MLSADSRKFLSEGEARTIYALGQLNGRKLVSISAVARRTKMTSSHTFRIVKKFVEEGLVSSEDIGRFRLVALTKRGKELYEILLQMINLMGHRL